ncbi:hypothetical protein IIE18_10550 [Pseudomonas sp. V1]|uniref:hypothetical protein n=1 Tax=Pseudomonas arcuscaelestis TaxID=2710591 RepID=UPI00193EF631|nr:hypothetical protein [Pseudomonas arcuscaelestis]MBM3105579.1 hypothetical protein [Pseudomonas arcuscaelestis]
MQTEFMGLRPEKWGEVANQAKLTRNRVRRRGWVLFISGFGAGVLVTALAVWLMP